MVDLVKQWKEAARRDDILSVMVPSDVRLLVKEIERLRQDYGQVVDKFDDCRAALARRVENDTGKNPTPPDDDSCDWHAWLIEQSDKAIDQSSVIAPGDGDG